MRLERGLKPKTSIDMTPLIDVIMQLIIFFMITTTFRTAPGIALSLPGSSTARPVPQEELRIVALSATELYVDGSRVELAGLDAAVKQAVSARLGTVSATGSGDIAAGSFGTDGERPPLRALVEGDAKADYQLVISVLDSLRKNGIDGVGLATRTAESGGGGRK